MIAITLYPCALVFLVAVLLTSVSSSTTVGADTSKAEAPAPAVR